MEENKRMDSLPQKIKRRIQSKGRGWVFSPKDFLDLGSRRAVDTALSRMASDGTLRRLRHGLYDYPKVNRLLGTISPSPDDIAGALARKTGHDVYPTGADAANMLGLSTQVPAQLIYLTTGPSKSCTVGKQTVTLKHSSLSRLLDLPKQVRLTVQAMLHLGKYGVDDDVIARLKASLNPKDKQKLISSINAVPGWLAPKIKAIAS